MKKNQGLFVILFVAIFSSARPGRSEEIFEQLRGRMRESCAKLDRWRAPIQLKGVAINIGTLVWVCPAGFRLAYGGPGAFEYSSNGVEAWIGRPAFSAKNPEIEHHWRLSGSDLELALSYLRGDDSKLALLKANFKLEAFTSPGVWGVTLSPFKPDNFSSLRLEWKLSTGNLSGARWTSLGGLPILFDIGLPETLPAGSGSAQIVPKIPVGARVTKIPAPRKN